MEDKSTTESDVATLRCDWVQIVEPKSKDFIYVNLSTGQCQWQPPSAVSVKKSDNSEWWELFDMKTKRFYYYNTHQQKTVWHRPTSCDIIPLAKLQVCKSGDSPDHVIGCHDDKITSTVDDDDAVDKKEEDYLSPRQRQQQQEKEEIATATKIVDEESKDDLAGVVPPSGQQLKEEVDPLLEEKQTEMAKNDDRANSRKPCSRDRHSHPEASAVLQASCSMQRDLSFPSSASSVPQRSLESPGVHDDDGHLPDVPRSCAFRRSSPPDCQMLTGEFTSSLAQLPLNSFRVAAPCFLRQESYPATSTMTMTRENGRGRELTGVTGEHAAVHDPSQQTFATPTSRPRAFPRTNPAYVGTYRRDRQGISYAKIHQSAHHLSTTTDDDDDRRTLTHAAPATNSSSRLSCYQAPTDDRSIYANLDRSPFPAERFDGGAVDARSLKTTMGTISKKQLSLWAGGGAVAVPPPALRNRNFCREVVGADDDETLTHSVRGSNRRFRDDDGTDGDNDFLPPPRHLATRQRASAPTPSDDTVNVQLRRRSEPEYVNVPKGGKPAPSSSNNVRPAYARAETLGNSLPDGACGYALPERRLDARNSDPRCGDHVSLDEYNRELIMDELRVHSSHGYSARNSDGLSELDCEDSDRGSAQSTPSPQSRQFQTIMPIRLQPSSSSSSSTYHPSLRKKKWLERTNQQPLLARQSTLEKAWLVQSDLVQHRPVSMVAASTSDSSVIANKVAGTLLQQMHIEQFVSENLNEHRKGILGKTVSVGHMLSWTKDVIQKPMIRTVNKSVKKEAIEVFKLIMMYMGDKKSKDSLTQIALDIIVKGWTMTELRDEIFIQLCRQTSKNPREESMIQGWELMGICLAFFPPSSKFYAFLDDHMQKSVEAHNHTDKSLMYLYMVSCQRRLHCVAQAGAKRGLRKPSLDDIEHAKKSLLERSMFGSTLDEIMNLQRERFPERRLPWIQTALSEQVLHLNGKQTEGIFRVPGDIDEVNALKVQCDRWSVPTTSSDPHLPASLLKLWYRELYEPLVPYTHYSQCLDNFSNPEGATAIISTLPEINRLVFTYLIRFLQEFAQPENASVTKMDVNNLAMVMAPNCLRCLSNDPRVIFENTRKEMGFIRTLILNLDTSSAKGLL